MGQNDSQFDLRLTKLSLAYQNDISNFDCDEPKLNDFIHKEALGFQEERLGITYLAYINDKLVGFVTISMADLKTERMELSTKLPIRIENYPALQISQLATDKRFQCRGIATNLIKWCMDKAVKYSEETGCRLLVLNTEKKIKFYKNRNFIMLKGQGQRREKTMYLVIPKEMFQNTTSSPDA